MENCKNCSCSCKPISEDCVTRYSDIQNPKVLNDSHYSKATDDIDDLIGDDCAEELCSALSAAVIQANEYNSANPTEDPRTFSFYLSSIWLNVINNKHFQKWYANRLLWHWLFGDSTSEIKLTGLITQSNTDPDYKNDFAQAQEKERKRMELSAKLYADQGRSKFLSRYWGKNINLYPCAVLECGCKKDFLCKSHCLPSQGIRSVVL